MVVVGDFMSYWAHRWLHTPMLWDYHAIHHSSETMDWLSSLRHHPVDDIINRVLQASPLLISGLSPIAIAIYVRSYLSTRR